MRWCLLIAPPYEQTAEERAIVQGYLKSYSDASYKCSTWRSRWQNHGLMEGPPTACPHYRESTVAPVTVAELTDALTRLLSVLK